MKKLLAALSLATTLATAPANLALAAVAPEVYPSVASGEAQTREAALSSALRHAVEQVVGMNVDSQTQVTNLKAIQDRVYVNATGFIQSYIVVDELKLPDGSYRIVVDAKVSRQKLTQEVSSITGKTVAFDGAVGVANLEQGLSQQEVLRRQLDDLLLALDDSGLEYSFTSSVEPVTGYASSASKRRLVLDNLKVSVSGAWLREAKQYFAKLWASGFAPAVIHARFPDFCNTTLDVRGFDEAGEQTFHEGLCMDPAGQEGVSIRPFLEQPISQRVRIPQRTLRCSAEVDVQALRATKRIKIEGRTGRNFTQD